jgi:signal transduction histidine kinase
MKEELKKILNEYKQLLKPVNVPSNLQIKRLKEVERDVILPIKWILILILVYYLFFSQLLSNREIERHFIQSFFIFYILFNTVLSVFLLTNLRSKLIKIRGVLFLNGVFDAILLTVLTLVTGGYSSMLYWLFVGLMLRNALVHPVAREQLTLNIIICLLYVSAGTLDIKIRDFERNAYVTVTEAELGIPPEPNVPSTNKSQLILDGKEKHITPSESHFETGLDEETLRSLDLLPPDNPEPVFLRTILLVLFAICFYGLQILLLRNEIATKERRLFESKSEQLQATSRIAAEIAHQIKNPLAIINNSAFMLQRTLKNSTDPVKQQIEIIREEVVKADKIVTELLGYAALAEGEWKNLML